MHEILLVILMQKNLEPITYSNRTHGNYKIEFLWTDFL